MWSRSQKSSASLLRLTCFKRFQPSKVFLQTYRLKRLDSPLLLVCSFSLGNWFWCQFACCRMTSNPDSQSNIDCSYASAHTIMGWSAWRRISRYNDHFKGMNPSSFKQDAEHCKTCAPVKFILIFLQSYLCGSHNRGVNSWQSPMIWKLVFWIFQG